MAGKMIIDPVKHRRPTDDEIRKKLTAEQYT
jgi:hypothetical protein